MAFQMNIKNYIVDETSISEIKNGIKNYSKNKRVNEQIDKGMVKKRRKYVKKRTPRKKLVQNKMDDYLDTDKNNFTNCVKIYNKVLNNELCDHKLGVDCTFPVEFKDLHPHDRRVLRAIKNMEKTMFPDKVNFGPNLNRDLHYKGEKQFNCCWYNAKQRNYIYAVLGSGNKGIIVRNENYEKELNRLNKLAHDLWIEKTDLLFDFGECDECMSTIYDKYTEVQERLDHIRNSYYEDMGYYDIDAEKYFYSVKKYFVRVQKKFKLI